MINSGILLLILTALEAEASKALETSPALAALEIYLIRYSETAALDFLLQGGAENPGLKGAVI
ncbi:hypothetical protein SDC9_181250 [bioreactor metagenome]|uniref:Uncharacterized protein n=1 Tax=bioreactor metagenome TaxID=1076179 RepID=A0A645H6Q4_9ZZZZ